MKYKPKITTIIPTYNRVQLLKRAIKSVLRQTYPFIQICVYDNNSDDGTFEEITEMAKNEPRIVYHRHPVNIGMINNFNFGLLHLKTEYFSFLSDDDVLLPNFYELALVGFERCPFAVFSACDVIEMTDSGDFLRARLSRWSREGCFHPPKGFLELLGKEPIWTGILFQSEIIKKIGYLDPNVGLAIDVDFIIRAASKNSYVISHKPGAIFVDHNASTSATRYPESFWQNWYYMIKKIVNDNSIDSDIRMQAEIKLKKQYRGFLFRTRAVINRDFSSASAAAKILNSELDRRFSASLLLLMIRVSEKMKLSWE